MFDSSTKGQYRLDTAEVVRLLIEIKKFGQTKTSEEIGRPFDRGIFVFIIQKVIFKSGTCFHKSPAKGGITYTAPGIEWIAVVPGYLPVQDGHFEADVFFYVDAVMSLQAGTLIQRFVSSIQVPGIADAAYS